MNTLSTIKRKKNRQTMTLLGLKSTIINHEKKISGHSLWEVGLSSGSFRASLGRNTHFPSGLSGKKGLVRL